MPTAGVVLIIAVVLIVLALVYYLVSTIVQLRAITNGLDEVIGNVGEILAKTEPVEPVVADINANLDAAVSALEGLLVKKAGMDDAMGLVDGLYPGAAAAGPRDFPESRDITPPRIGEVYTKGTLTLARLGREAPIAAGTPRTLAGHRHRLAGAVRAARRHRKAAQADEERLMQTPAPFGYER